MRSTLFALLLCASASATPVTYDFPINDLTETLPFPPPERIFLDPVTLTVTTDGKLGALSPSDILSWTGPYEDFSSSFNSTYPGAATILPDVTVFANGTMMGTIRMTFSTTVPGQAPNIWSGSFTMGYESATGSVLVQSDNAGTVIWNGNAFAPFVPAPEPASDALMLVGIAAALVGWPWKPAAHEKGLRREDP
jgi:hypothetical protein